MMGLHFSVPEAGRLLGGRHELRHPLLGGSELCGQLSLQPCLLGEVIPDILLLLEELAFLLTTCHKGL
jgi:hypothetical protein